VKYGLVRRSVGRSAGNAAVMAAIMFAFGRPHAIAAKESGGLLCAVDKAAGIYFNKAAESWSITNFKADSNYIVRVPTAEDIQALRRNGFFTGDWTPPYIVLRLGDSWPLNFCERPPDKSTSTMVCSYMAFMSSFAVNFHTLRMERIKGGGYTLQDDRFASDLRENPADSISEIGRYAPL